MDYHTLPALRRLISDHRQVLDDLCTCGAVLPVGEPHADHVAAVLYAAGVRLP